MRRKPRDQGTAVLCKRRRYRKDRLRSGLEDMARNQAQIPSDHLGENISLKSIPSLPNTTIQAQAAFECGDDGFNSSPESSEVFLHPVAGNPGFFLMFEFFLQRPVVVPRPPWLKYHYHKSPTRRRLRCGNTVVP